MEDNFEYSIKLDFEIFKNATESEAEKILAKEILQSLILRNELGEDISLIEKKRLDTINKLLKKGKLSNLSDYELISGRIDEIYADAGKAEEVKQLNELLLAYQNVR